jgi:uncharacterized protein (DUF2147 family)
VPSDHASNAIQHTEIRSPQKIKTAVVIVGAQISLVCLFSTSGGRDSAGYLSAFVMTKEGAMKALALLTAAAMALSTVAASAQTYVGKGKAPPPPVVTKG